MKTLKDILEQLNIAEEWENQEDIYAREILEDIDKWLEEETEKQNYIEENLRSNK